MNIWEDHCGQCVKVLPSGCILSRLSSACSSLPISGFHTHIIFCAERLAVNTLSGCASTDILSKTQKISEPELCKHYHTSSLSLQTSEEVRPLGKEQPQGGLSWLPCPKEHWNGSFLEDSGISVHEVLVFIPDTNRKIKGMKIYNLESDVVVFRRKIESSKPARATE